MEKKKLLLRKIAFYGTILCRMEKCQLTLDILTKRGQLWPLLSMAIISQKSSSQFDMVTENSSPDRTEAGVSDGSE